MELGLSTVPYDPLSQIPEDASWRESALPKQAASDGTELTVSMVR